MNALWHEAEMPPNKHFYVRALRKNAIISV